jgi:hypothetical protein
MLTRRNFILSAACAAVAAPAFAADQSARDLVAAIYAAYKGKKSQGIVLDNAGAVRRYFALPLAALIIKDMDEAAKRGDVGALDGDPFIDGQDWEIASFDIAVSEPAPAKARATVKFDNAGTPKTVVLDLIKIDNAWRIGEITWRHDGKDETLSGQFRSQ